MSSSNSSILGRILVGGATLGFVWLFYSHALTSFKLREKDSQLRLTDLRERFHSARKTLGEVETAEQKAEKARLALNELLGEQPEDSLMVSIPERLKQHFSRYGFQVAVVRLNAARDEPGLPGYRRVYWSLGLPLPETGGNVTGLLLAVAELEKEHRLMRVVDFSLQRDVEDPDKRTAGVNVSVFMQK